MRFLAFFHTGHEARPGGEGLLRVLSVLLGTRGAGPEPERGQSGRAPAGTPSAP
jgi:hypothetical protein